MQNSSPTPATVGDPLPSIATVGDPSPSPHGSRLSAFILKILKWVFIAVMIILCVLVIFVIFELFYPTVPHFEVESLSLTNFDSTESVTGTWQVVLLVKNQKRYFAVNYAALKSTVCYKNVPLSEILNVPFRQGSMSKTTLNVTLSAVDVKVERFVLDDMNRERERGLVVFDVHVAGGIQFVPEMMKDFSHFNGWKWNLHVLCSTVDVSISSNTSSGNLVGGATDCKVDYYRQ